VSPQTAEYAGILFQLLSFLAEICIFLELGLSVFGLHKSYYFGFISWAFVAALLGRALSVYPLSAIYNFSLTRPVMVCGDTTDVSDSTTEKKSNNSDSSIEEEAATVNQDKDDEKINGRNDHYGIIDDDGIIMQTEQSSGGDDDDNNSESSNSKDQLHALASKHQHVIQRTLHKTSSYISELGGKRETPTRKRDKVIPLKFMHILWFAGLRGAVAYACSREFPDVNGNRNAFIAATMCIVLVTIVLMGGATEPLMDRLKIRMNVDNDEYMKVWHKQRRLKGRFLHFGT
jgi:NhaP-type Na+/H+ or K+/H+ antiporter